MNKLVRAVVATLMAATPVMAVTGVAAAKEVSKKQYAVVVCSALRSTRDRIDDFVHTYNDDGADDPAVFQRDALTLTADLLDDLARIKVRLGKSFPAADHGRRLTRGLTSHLQDRIDDIAHARRKLGSANPKGVAFVGAVAGFELTFNTGDLRTIFGPDPLQGVKDQGLVRAFRDEPSCHGLLRVGPRI